MNPVDWSQAPEGAFAFCVTKNASQEYGVWVVSRGLGVFKIATAKTFGVEFGCVVQRPSAAEAELRIKADMWKSIHDDLFNVAEQIKSERDELLAEVARLKDTSLQVRRCETLLDMRNKLQEKNDALIAERDELRAELDRLRADIEDSAYNAQLHAEIDEDVRRNLR